MPYLIDTHLGGQIRSQLQCIEKLSHQLILEANLSNDPLHGLVDSSSILPNIINRLNRIIFELSNFTDLNQPVETKNAPKNVGGDNKLGDIDGLVREWYTTIQGKREQLYKTGANQETIKLTVSHEDEISKAAALNERLLSETLLSEKDKIEQMESTLEKVYIYQDDFKSVYGKNKEALQTNIEKLMQNNINAYLEVIFKGPTIPKFKLTESLNLPQVIVDLVREWFYEATTYAYDLQIFCSMGLRLGPEYNDFALIERIKEIWSIMEDANYIPKTTRDTVALAIDECRIVANSFRTQQNKERLIGLILNPPGPSPNRALVVAAAAVTVEYFYQRHAAAYSQYYANLYMQYIKILD